jgi:hypothetical protein
MHAVSKVLRPVLSDLHTTISCRAMLMRNATPKQLMNITDRAEAYTCYHGTVGYGSLRGRREYDTFRPFTHTVDSPDNGHLQHQHLRT